MASALVEFFVAPPGNVKANSATVMVNKTIALAASDQCTPISPPNTPTVKPLKALSPMLAMANKPISRPRSCGGDSNCTIV